MAVKTLTITKEAYTHLKELKRPDESFSKVIERLYHQKKPVSLDDVAGILSEEEGKELKRISRETRKNLSFGLKRRARAWPK